MWNSSWIRWLVCSVLSVAPAVAWGAGDEAAAEDSSPAGCDRASFVFLDARAKSVLVTGSFTQPTPWTNDVRYGALAMTSDGHGAWLLRVSFPAAARTLYKFIVDGSSEWTPDPLNPDRVADGTGHGVNSVITVCRAR